MRITTKVEGNLRLDMETEIRVGKMAALAAVAGVGAAIKQNWRDQIKQAGLGSRLGNTVRSDVYPKGVGSLNAATLVWSKAKKIVGAFETGVEITAKNGKYLALPITQAGFRAGGGRGRGMTPEDWERRTGRVLSFVPRKSGVALLVDTGTRSAAAGRRLRRGEYGPRQASARPNRVKPIFILVPRVRLQKRLGLYSAADRLAQSMGARLVAGWRD